MDAVPAELLPVIHDCLDLRALLRLGAASPRLQGLKGAGRVFVVTVALNPWMGSYYDRYSDGPGSHQVAIDQTTEIYSSLGGATSALRALRKSTRTLFHVEPPVYYQSTDKTRRNPIMAGGTLARVWRPRTSAAATKWETWTHFGDPDESQDSGVRMTITLTIRKMIESSPKSLLVALKSSRGYKNAVIDALEYRAMDREYEPDIDLDRERAEFLSVDV